VYRFAVPRVRIPPPLIRTKVFFVDAGAFEPGLLVFERRRPFQPFIVVVVNGDRLQMDHAESLVIRDGTAVLIAVGGVPTLFDRESVKMIGEFTPEDRKSKSIR
jgi:hypothetical protein